MEKIENDDNLKRIEVLHYIMLEKWYLIANNTKKKKNRDLRRFDIVNQLLTYQNDLDRFYHINFFYKKN